MEVRMAASAKDAKYYDMFSMCGGLLWNGKYVKYLAGGQAAKYSFIPNI